MPPGKKLQVFVSSTYTDLKAERQAAVEAILTAGHIPAGMEMFTACDDSQLRVIRRWIDESDVFLLILGGRYGSLEPTTKKSYTHLEYEYAIERGKPLFAVVIHEHALEERVKSAGTSVIEIDHAAQLRAFRQIVLKKMVRFWSGVGDIKLAVHETMSEFSWRPELTGWVSGNQAVNGSALAAEIARLTEENRDLRSRLAASAAPVVYNGLSFEGLRDLLRLDAVNPLVFPDRDRACLQKIAAEYEDSQVRLLHLLWHLKSWFTSTTRMKDDDLRLRYLERLEFYGIVMFDSQITSDGYRYPMLTRDGRNFLLRLMSESLKRPPPRRG